MKYKVIIADEEFCTVELVSKLLETFPDYNIIGKIHHHENLIPTILQLQPDLIIMGISSKNGNGICQARLIHELFNTQLIFVTAYSQFALQAFDCDACGFILKPVTLSYLAKALKHFEEHHCITTNNWHNVHKLKFNTLKGLILINTPEILYLQADQAYSYIRTNNDKLYHVCKNLGKIELNLFERNFIRCSRSIIVNIKYLKEICRSKKTCKVGQIDVIYELKIGKTGINKIENILHL